MNVLTAVGRTPGLAAAALLLLIAGPAHGQTNAEVDGGLQFRFSSPGARSLGMGGAFVGLADDATAAYTNPAGLVQLSRPEVSAEGQRSSYANQFTDRGHALGSPSGNGQDDIAGLRFGSTEAEINDLAFASLVYPFNVMKHRLVVAVYRQELADFGASFRADGAFVSTLRLLPTSDSLRLRIVNEGASFALRLGNHLSAGLGLSVYHFELSSVTDRYNLTGFYSPPDFAANNVESFETQNGAASDVGVDAGLLWTSTSRQWHAGAVYRQGPRFDFATSNQAGPAVGAPGTVYASNTASFHVPDFYGAGASYQPTDQWTVSVEYDRIRYSQLASGSIDIYSPPAIQDPAVRQLLANDVNQVHLGLEYELPFQLRRLFLRLGGWTDPDHRVRFVRSPSPEDVEAELLSALFVHGPQEIHATCGVGISLGNRMDINAGFDYSRLVSVASLTAVFHFQAVQVPNPPASASAGSTRP